MNCLKKFVIQISSLPKLTIPVTRTSPEFLTQIRTRYTNKWMRRDVKRRELSKEHNPLRTRLNCIRHNNILPKEIQEKADLDISMLPRDAFPTRIHKRCVMTSRPRGLYNRYRLSRIQWRLLADYNKLSGVTRSWW